MIYGIGIAFYFLKYIKKRDVLFQKEIQKLDTDLTTHRKNFETQIKEIKKNMTDQFLPFLKKLDDKNYQLWKAKLKAEEKLEKMQKSILKN